MASESAPVPTRRFSNDVSQLSPTRSAGTLIVAAGAEAASKARQLRQLRHAATFSLQYQDADANDGQLGTLLHRQLLTQTQEVTPLADAKNLVSPRAVASSKKMSAKMERALHVRDRCEHNLERYCEAKHRAPRGSSSPKSPCGSELLEKSFWLNPENVFDSHTRDKAALDRLLRKLSPGMKNSATTHSDLVHLLHACAECSLRATFCVRCAKRASEFFDNYSTAELQMLYCRELPPPDSKALAAFAEAIAERELLATH